LDLSDFSRQIPVFPDKFHLFQTKSSGFSGKDRRLLKTLNRKINQKQLDMLSASIGMVFATIIEVLQS